MRVIELIRVPLKCVTKGYYIRWYFNGWHHFFFKAADEEFNTSGEAYNTKLTYKLTIGDEQLTKEQLKAIAGIYRSQYVFMLTSDGWKALTVEDAPIDYGRNDRVGTGIALTINVWAKVGQYTPIVLPTIIPPPIPVVVTDFKYGYLYNWFVTQGTGDSSILSAAMEAEGWDIPSETQWDDLITELGGASIAGGKLKEVGLTYWGTPNTDATNVAKFNARGAGVREYFNGNFQSIKTYTSNWNKTNRIDYNIQNNTAAITKRGTEYPATGGFPLRVIREVTVAEQSLPDGILPDTYYIGNDGKIYECTKIGEQVWITANLAETKFRDLSEIPTVTDNTEWAALTEAAKCAYENTESNVLI